MAVRRARCQHFASFPLSVSSFHIPYLPGLHETETDTAWSGNDNDPQILTDNLACSFDQLQEAHWPNLAALPAMGPHHDVPDIDLYPNWLTQDPADHQFNMAEVLQAQASYAGYQK
jgi:hypothetical protein